MSCTVLNFLANGKENFLKLSKTKKYKIFVEVEEVKCILSTYCNMYITKRSTFKNALNIFIKIFLK